MTATFQLPDHVREVTFGDGCGKSHKPDKNGKVQCDECAAVAGNYTFHAPPPPDAVANPDLHHEVVNQFTGPEQTPTEPGTETDEEKVEEIKKPRRAKQARQRRQPRRSTAGTRRSAKSLTAAESTSTQKVEKPIGGVEIEGAPPAEGSEA